MVLRKVIFLAALLVISLLGSGCRTTGKHLNWYQGSQRATNEVALLKLPRNPMSGYSLIIDTIDGTNVSKIFTINNTTQIELLPGKHTIGVFFMAGNWRSVTDIKISFDCEASHVYGVFVSPTQISRHGMEVKDFLGGIWGGKCLLTAWIVDGNTKKVVAGQRDTKYFLSSGCMVGCRNNGKGNRLTSPEYALQGIVKFELTVLVDDLVNQLKAGDVQFKWYSGDKLVAETRGEECFFSFNGVLNTVRLGKNASTFGLGHFKVIAFIEGEEVASGEFNVVL